MPAIGYTRSRGVEIARKARDTGLLVMSGERGIPSPEWNVAGKCNRPVFRTLSWGTYDAIAHGDIRTNVLKARGRTHMQTLDIWAKCRRCPACLKVRSHLWRRRAAAEIAAAKRTWFGTLTLSPAAHFQMLARARHRLRAGEVNFDRLSPDEQFLERHREVSKELTKWIKRLRKNSRAKLRVLVVAERHKSGLPHYHCLLHEVTNDPIRHSVLARSWPLGFTNYKLVHDKRAASYVSKYLSKAATARVRASAAYGKTSVYDQSAGPKEQHVNTLTTQPTTGMGTVQGTLHGISNGISQECSPQVSGQANAGLSNARWQRDPVPPPSRQRQPVVQGPPAPDAPSVRAAHSPDTSGPPGNRYHRTSDLPQSDDKPPLSHRRLDQVRRGPQLGERIAHRSLHLPRSRALHTHRAGEPSV